MKFLKSKFFLISVIVLAVLILATALFSVFGLPAPLRTALKTVARPFEWCGAKVSDAVNGFVGAFTDYERLQAENEELRAALDSAEADERENEVLRAENEWLKEYLQLAGEHPELILTDARVISREAGNTATVLTLDRGRVHGIKLKMPVITADGVLGYVEELGLDWCKVVTVVETASAVGVYTDRTGVEGVAEGDPELSGEGTCRMTYIEPDADIRIGDLVYTGYGSIYPPGLLLGTVESIGADEYTRKLVATVRPAVDFTDLDSISRVMVVCGYAEE